MNSDFASSMQGLLEYRKKIDDLDRELLHLLNQRAEIASRLGGIKTLLGRSSYDAGRERQVLTVLCEANGGPLDRNGVLNIFGSIIKECRRVQGCTADVGEKTYS